jgi:hypothetical protein
LRDSCTEVLHDADGPAGSLSVRYLHRCDEYSHPLFHWAIRNAEGRELDAGDDLSLDKGPPDPDKAMGRLVARLLDAARTVGNFLDGDLWATSDIVGFSDDVRSFAYLNADLLDQAAEKFNSRDVGPYF